MVGTTLIIIHFYYPDRCFPYLIYHISIYIPSGNLTVCYWKWPIEIVDLPNLKMVDFPYKSLFSHGFPTLSNQGNQGNWLQGSPARPSAGSLPWLTRKHCGPRSGLLSRAENPNMRGVVNGDTVHNIHVYVYVRVYIYIYTSIYMTIYIYAIMYVYIYIHMYVVIYIWYVYIIAIYIYIRMGCFIHVI